MAVDLPGFIAKLAGGKVTLNEVQQWRDSGGSTDPVRDGTIKATMAGQPGGVVGTLRIDEAGGSTTVSIDAEISVQVPLVGGRIERFVADMLDKLLAYEETLGREWLAAPERRRRRPRLEPHAGEGTGPTRRGAIGREPDRRAGPREAKGHRAAHAPSATHAQRAQLISNSFSRTA